MKPIPRDDIAFIPLKLPKTGEALLTGRQYLIDPVARAVIIDRFGVNPPKYVECLHSAACARTVTSITTFADGRPSVTTVMEVPAREATFRGFFKFKKTVTFLLKLEVVEELRQFYVDAPKAPEEEFDGPREKKSTEGRVAKPRLAMTTEDILAL